MCRKLLREAVRGKTPPDPAYEKLIASGQTLPLYAQDSVLQVPELPQAEDRKQILSLGKRVLEIMRSADELPATQRDAHVRHQLDLIDGGLSRVHEADTATPVTA
jgi:hypothetical protein